MQHDDWSKVAEVFSQLVDLPPGEQAEAIASAGLTDAQHDTLNRLLTSHKRSTGFFKTGGATPAGLVLLSPGDMIGNWRVEAFLGAGGMGEVYRVDRADGHYSQTGALKRIAHADREAFEHFSRERQVLARLEHPNIARLIDGGVAEDGTPFLVMEMIEGETLAEHAVREGLSREAILTAFLNVCEALSHAHGRLVLHRDIKPSNVMVTREGVVKVIDFGVAGLVDERSSPVRAPMTLAYAAPEQLAGEAASVASDVFGLGATLHELLTGEPPARKGASAVVKQGALPRDLQAILARTLAHDPAARYASAGALAGDIERFLSKEPVEARGGGAGYRFGRFIVKYPVGALLGIGLVAALALGIVGTTTMMLRAQDALKERDLAFKRSQAASLRAQAGRNTLRTIIVRATESTGEASTTIPSLIEQEIETEAARFTDMPDLAGPRLFALAQLSEQRGDLRLLLKALQPQADNPDVVTPVSSIMLLYYGTFSTFTGDYEGARAALVRSIALMQEDPDFFAEDLLVARGQLAEIDGDVETMDAVVDEVIALTSGFDLSTDERRIRYVYLNEFASYWSIILDTRPRTIAMLESALEVNSQVRGPQEVKDSTLLNNLVGQYLRSKDYENAQALNDRLIEYLEREVGPSVDLGLAYRMGAMAMTEQGDQDGAIAAFETAADLFRKYDVENSDILFYTELDIARSLARKRETEAAFAMIEETVARNQGLIYAVPVINGQYLLKLGQTKLAAGDGEGARADFEQSLAVLTEDGSRPDLIGIVTTQLEDS
ncbi:hypothetical protein HY29_16985 [Hyphomonas beringensis]|uniref:Protein kinase domain-containing protein n=1 Tax=Hyphomonas beringensis TaxID=1280946 RepID=A0A062UAB9_9PROT|nr:hypothetical protein HY29_16985 [Hyphomonas beringensis]